MKRPRTWLRTCAGLLLAAVIWLASLWIAAPRLAERKIQQELARLGVPVSELHLRSVTPWTLELEPVCLGTDPDAPALGVLRVTYVPREILRGKLRTVTLEGARLVVRRAKSGGWEVVGADKLLPKRADSTKLAPSPSLKRIMASLPDSVSVLGISVIAETENGRLAFPLALNAVRHGDTVDLYVAAQGFGGKAELAAVLEAKPDMLACTGKLRVRPPRKVAIGGVRVSLPEKMDGTMELQWSPEKKSLLSALTSMSAEALEVGGDGWTARITNAVARGGIASEEKERDKRYFLDVELRGLSARLPDGIVLNLGDIPIQIMAKGKTVRVEASVRPSGSALSTTVAVSANLETKEVALSATVPPAVVSEKDPALVPFLPASLKSAAFSATVGGRADLIWKPGSEPKGTAELTLAGGTFALDGCTARITNAVACGGIATEEKDSGNGYVLDVGLRGLSACLPDGILLNVAMMQCPLRGSPGAGFEAQCTLRNANFSIPKAQLEAEGVDADLAFAWSEKAGLRSAVFRPKTEPDKIHSVKIRGVNLGEIPLHITADGKAVRVEASVKPPGSALSTAVAVSANLETKEIAVTATVPPAVVSEKDQALAPFLPPSLKGAAFSGTVGGRTDVTWKPGGELKGTAEVTLAGGKFSTADGKFDVDGVECGLKLESLSPLRSFPTQRLKFASAHAAGTPLTNGKFAFRLDPPDTVFIEHGDFGWCGGRLTCAAVRITGGKPDGMVMLRAEQVDVGQLTGMVKDFGGHADGWLTGRVPLLFKPDGVRLGDVHLIGDPDKPGTLQLDPGKWPGNQVDTLGVSPAVKKAMKQTFQNMSLNLLRLDALPGTDKKSTRLCLRVAGTPRDDTDLPPVDLTINLNIEERLSLLWNLLNPSVPRK